jgi:uncharacterized protein YyaL (SSP411 family)
VVEETLDYLLRDMRHPEGGFYSSQDADSEGVEGKYYVWTPTEIFGRLGDRDADILGLYYAVTSEGNFDGENIFHVPTPPRDVAEALGATEEELLDTLRPIKARLLDIRRRRVPPPTDDKVLTAWNAMALRAFAQAALVLGNDTYRDAAERNGAFLLDRLYSNGRLLRTWKDSRASLNAYLEDYSLLVLGLLALHEATFSHRWLHAAKALTDEMLSLFWDAQQRTLFDVGNDHEALVVRPRELFDNAMPSGSSAAAEALIRMATLTGDQEYRRKAALLLESAAGYFSVYALGFGQWLNALDLYLAEPLEIAIVGKKTDSATAALMGAVTARFLPNRLLLGRDPADANAFPTPILEGRDGLAGHATAYVCRAYACNLPATDPQMLAQQLGG